MVGNKNISNDRVSVYLQKQKINANKLLSKKNSFFYFSLVLCSIVTLVVAWFVEGNTQGVVKMPVGFSVRYLLLLMSIVCLVALIAVFVDYLFLYKNAKQRRFWLISSGLLLNRCYELLSLSKQKTIYKQYLNSNGIDSLVSKKLVVGKVVSEKFSKLIYSFIVLMVGTIFLLEKTDIWLYILSIFIIIVIGISSLEILFFDHIKEKYAYFVAKLSKFLYKCKLINDYEEFYNNRIAKFVYYGSGLKSNKLNIIVQTLAGVIVKFLKHLVLFVVLAMFNFSSEGVFLEILFKLTILDLVLGCMPLPNGIFVYEFLFLTLFRNVFFSGYVLYGMVVYRIITDFLIYAVYGFNYLIKGRKQINTLRDNLNVL